MTVTIGFLCRDGVVLGADSQESYEGSALKRSVPKLIVFPPIGSADEAHEAPDRRLIFTGAGDSSLVDKLIDDAWLEAAIQNPNIVEIATAIERRFLELYGEYNKVFHAGYMPPAQVTYGIWCRGETRLYYAQGPVINEIGRQTGIGYKASGMGNEITDYIRDRIKAKPTTVEDAIVLTSYMLKQAVAHGEGCGGEVRISVLRNNGHAENVNIDNFTTQILEALDSHISFALFRAANPRTSDKTFAVVWEAIYKKIVSLRNARSEAARKEREEKEALDKTIKEIENELDREREKYKDNQQ